MADTLRAARPELGSRFESPAAVLRPSAMANRCVVCRTEDDVSILTLSSTTGLDVEHHLCGAHLQRWIFEAGESIGRMAREQAEPSGKNYGFAAASRSRERF